jgi:hypothetical protein
MRRVWDKVLLFTAVGFFAVSAAAQDSPACPSIKVIGPAGITSAGDTMEFRLESDAELNSLRFRWSVDLGVIEKGQDTPAISVQTSRELQGQTVTASGSDCWTASWMRELVYRDRAYQALVGCYMPSDDFGDLEPNDVRVRMDAFFLELMNNPTSRGLIIITRAKNEVISESHPRVELIAEQIEFRNFDPGRFEFYFEIDEGELRTQLHHVPPAQTICSRATRVSASTPLSRTPALRE